VTYLLPVYECPLLVLLLYFEANNSVEHGVETSAERLDVRPILLCSNPGILCIRRRAFWWIACVEADVVRRCRPGRYCVLHQRTHQGEGGTGASGTPSHAVHSLPAPPPPNQEVSVGRRQPLAVSQPEVQRVAGRLRS
jgi:hypothetical protein